MTNLRIGTSHGGQFGKLQADCTGQLFQITTDDLLGRSRVQMSPDPFERPVVNQCTKILLHFPLYYVYFSRDHL